MMLRSRFMLSTCCTPFPLGLSQPSPTIVLKTQFCSDCLLHGDIPDKASSDSISAGGMTRRPYLRNRRGAIFTPSRRNAISHRMVASEPVTERLGPRSTPISIAPATCGGTCAAWLAAAAIRPTGRLLMRLEATATTMPATHDVVCGDAAAASCRLVASADNTPVRFNPATTTNRPGTSGRTLQETSLRIGSGDCRAMTSTMAVKDAPAQKVGNPSGRSNADADSSTTTVNAIPIAASLPPNVSGGASLIAASFVLSAGRCVSRNTTYVARIATSDGPVK